MKRENGKTCDENQCLHSIYTFHDRSSVLIARFVSISFSFDVLE